MNTMHTMLADITRETGCTSTFTGRHTLSPRVMEAIAKVPRRQFVPRELQEYAFDNGPLPIGHGQTISQPYIVALMTDLLDPGENSHILEIGTGSGYQTAILSLLAAKVYTVEAIEALGVQAVARFKALHYNNIASRIGNGCQGWAEHAPFDGIIVTAAAAQIPDALLQQLKPGGRLVIPVGAPHFYQELLLVEKQADGAAKITKILDVAFVPLIDYPESSIPKNNTATVAATR